MSIETPSTTNPENYWFDRWEAEHDKTNLLIAALVKHRTSKPVGDEDDVTLWQVLHDVGCSRYHGGRMSHYGILGDQQRKAENIKQVASDPTLILCDYCEGTGNEFYSMYRACPKCGGLGVIEVEIDAALGTEDE